MREAPSELQLFLQAYEREGSDQGEGSFTLAKEKALAKLAEFQLPFAGGWALKIVQAVVAGGDSTSLRVGQNKSETRFHFEIPHSWTPTSVEDAFFDPIPSSDRSLDHLMRALWAVGLNQKRPFEIRLNRHRARIIWNGLSFHRFDLEKPDPENRAVVTIAHRGLDDERGRFVESRAIRRRNADVAKALTDYAYTCPLPLTLDWRRLDALQYCPDYGVSVETHPYLLGFCPTALGSFGLPQRTFDYLPVEEVSGPRPARLKALSSSVVSGSQAYSMASLAYMFSYHAHDVGTAFEKKRSSVCFWLQDGVVVDQQKLAVSEGTHTVAMWLSAEGLDNDLTTLRLRESADREERLRTAVPHLTKPLSKCQGDFFEPAVQGGAFKGRAIGGLVFLGSLSLAPLTLIGAGVGVASFLVGATSHHETTKEFRENLQSGCRKLFLDWSQTYGHSP